MSALRDAVDALFRFLNEAGVVPPTRDVWLLEIGPDVGVDERGRLRVRRVDYQDPESYECRFAQLLRARLPWINMSCYGMDKDRLLVAVEVPPTKSRQSTRTSLNFSGPSSSVRDHGWDANEVLAIE